MVGTELEDRAPAHPVEVYGDKQWCSQASPILENFWWKDPVALQPFL